MHGHPGLRDWAVEAGAPASDDRRATLHNGREPNSQSKKLDFIRLWGTFPFTGDFTFFSGDMTHGTTVAILTTAAAMLTRKVRK